MDGGRPVEADEIARVHRACSRALLACAHACLSASFDLGPGGTRASRACLRVCTEAAGVCLELHRTLAGPHDATLDLLGALSTCGEACRHAELICHTLRGTGLALGGTAAACSRCAQACRDLASALRDVDGPYESNVA
jgi:hypothetical protein